MRIALVYPASGERVDGIRDYATRVTEQLAQQGESATLLRPPRGPRLCPTLIGAVPRGEEVALIVQYNPYSWGRWGIAPLLPLAVALVRVLRPHARVLLAIHEGYVEMRDFRAVIVGAWQRLQVRILLALTHGAVATTGRLTTELSRGWPHRRIKHLPVGSNLPDGRASRSRARALAGYEDALVVASFTSGHDSYLRAHVASAAEGVARSVSQPVVLLLLGSDNTLMADLTNVTRTVAPGYLDEAALSAALSTADLFLAPFVDGATTRRTTLIAALQHGIATVTTVSPSTEPVLKADDGPALAAVEDVDRFVAEAVRLALDRSARARCARAGRALYEQQFSWTVVCAGLRASIAAGFAIPS